MSQVGPKGQSPFVSHCLCMAQNIYQTFAFLTPCELPSSHLKPQTSTPNIHFYLQLKMIFKVIASAVIASYLDFLSLSHVYMLQTFVSCFLLLMSHGNVILRLARRMQKGRGNVSSSQTAACPRSYSLVMMKLVFKPRWSCSKACKTQIIWSTGMSTVGIFSV